MIHGGAEDSTDIENSNSDAERRTPTPSSARRDDASADRGSSPDKARGSDATTAAVEERPELRPARHSIDQIVAQLDPHAPRALEPDRTIDETTTRGDMSAAVANGVGTHKVQVQVQDESENSSDSDDDKPIVAPKETAAQYKGTIAGCEACAKGFARQDLLTSHYISAHPDMMDEVDKILAQDPAEKEVAELAVSYTHLTLPTKA